MLHILLGILKIFGIILAVILALTLLIVCVVLFAALRYEVRAASDGDLKNLEATVKFSWLFHLISGFVIYKEKNLDWQVKIAWKKLNEPKKADEPVTENFVEKPNIQPEQKVERSLEEKAENKIELKTVDRTENKTDVIPQETNKKKKAKKKTDKKIKFSIQKISDKIKEIRDLKDRIVSFIKAEKHKKAFQKLLQEVLRLLKKLKPKKLKADVEFGFEDPYTTGSILAYASMLYPFYGDNISITPNFEEVILKGDVFIKGRLRVSYLVSMGIRLIIDKNVRLTIKDTMKLIAKK